MKTYKIGIIGYGGFGRFLHHWWSKLENVDVVAVSDHSRLGQNEQQLRFYSNWQDLIADEEIDIVSIVTPPALHVEMACAAMRAGKHVILEKPVAIDEQGAQQILDVQKGTGMAIAVNHMIRYNPIITTLIGLGKNGSLGKLRHAVVNNYAQDAALPASHWFWDESLSGGIFVEHGVHFFDIVNALSDQKYTEICGSSDRRNDAQRDRVAAMVKYDKGLIASYFHAFSGPGIFEQTTIELAYDLARFEIQGWMPLNGKLKALVNDKILEQLQTLPGWQLDDSQPLNSGADDSRPEGWGGSDETAPAEKQLTYCGGIAYEVDSVVTATFKIPQTKGQVYGECVQKTLLDVIAKIEDNSHTITTSVENAVEALIMALEATR